MYVCRLVKCFREVRYGDMVTASARFSSGKTIANAGPIGTRLPEQINFDPGGLRVANFFVPKVLECALDVFWDTSTGTIHTMPLL